MDRDKRMAKTSERIRAGMVVAYRPNDDTLHVANAADTQDARWFAGVAVEVIPMHATLELRGDGCYYFDGKMVIAVDTASRQRAYSKAGTICGIQ